MKGMRIEEKNGLKMARRMMNSGKVMENLIKKGS